MHLILIWLLKIPRIYCAKISKLGFIHLPPSKRTFSCPLLTQKCNEINITQISTNLHWFFNSPYVNSWILWWKPQKGVHSTFKVSSRCPYIFCQKERWFFVNVCQLSWIEMIDHQGSVLFVFVLVLLDHLSYAKVYIKIDICGGYNLVCIRKGDEWKMTFKICYGHFEYVVMPFGLINMLVIFQHLMNIIFCEYLDDFVVCYIDDIFIF
jgi:hypothetical protein